jgi:hypothetical protein
MRPLINRQTTMVVACPRARPPLLERGLKVLRQAQLPKWRGSFQWQIEALQAAYTRLRAEVAKEGGLFP